MEKTLIAVGNSLALVIDRPVRQLLGIGRDTVLRLSLDGRRLVLEPVEKSGEPMPVERLDVMGVAEAMIDEFGLSQQHLVALAPGIRSIGGLYGRAERARQDEAALDPTIPRRLAACLGHLRAGLAWSQAIAAAWAEVP